MRSFILFTLALLCWCHSMAQEDPLTDKVWFGVGIGLDHGGLGVRVDVRPMEHLGAFAGAGWAVGGPGWNAGLHVPLLTDRKANPYLTGMYGYNAVYVRRTLLPPTTIAERTVYYGPSFGGGVEFPYRKGTRLAHVGLLVPVRSDQLLKDHPEVEEQLWPVLFTLGLKFRT